VEDNAGNQKELFKVMNNLLQRSSEPEYPQILKLIKQSATKSCSLDPIPTTILKQCLDGVLPAITNIINTSLSTSNMPDELKEALLSPLLKKVLLDTGILKHFRPVSNLAYLSKLIETTVDIQLTKHAKDNGIEELFQAAYKEHNSTETALLKVHNDLMCAVDEGKAVVMVLLDLSATFDTVDHDILLQRLHTYLGVTGNALAWFQSYLHNGYCLGCLINKERS
jgi:hypothetical protein